VNSPAFLTGIARLCAEFGVVCVSLLGVLQTAFINTCVVGSKLFALVLKSYRPLLSSTSSGFRQGWFFYVLHFFTSLYAPRRAFKCLIKF
jgi:hypothetical protein